MRRITGRMIRTIMIITRGRIRRMGIPHIIITSLVRTRTVPMNTGIITARIIKNFF